MTVEQKKKAAKDMPKKVNQAASKQKAKPSATKKDSNKSDGMYSQAKELLFSVFMRTLIYKDSFSATLVITKASMGLNFLLVFAVILLAFKEPPSPKVLGLSEDGRFLELTPLTEDSMKPKQITSWAERCALSLNSYTFYSAIQHLNGVIPECLTDEAARVFRNNFEKEVLDDLRKNEQSFEASLDGAGIIVAEGIIDGRKAYRVQVPIIVSRYDKGRETKNLRYLIKLQIVRVSQEKFWEGIRIFNYREEGRR
tara:strand:+ start:760 stop:1521 length:762 start_codon:yes stop_codon:yes gene_type:complete